MCATKKKRSPDMKFRATPEERITILENARLSGKTFSKFAKDNLLDRRSIDQSGVSHEALVAVIRLQKDVSHFARDVLDRAEPIEAVRVIAHLRMLTEDAKIIAGMKE